MAAVTCVVAWSRPRDMREMFLRGYAAYAPRCREHDEPGLAVLAVNERTGMPAGCLHLRAGYEHRAAIVGRHGRCDLVLDHHSGLALRHLAVVLDPVGGWRVGSTAHYRVLDL